MKRSELVVELKKKLEDYFISDSEKEWIDLKIVNIVGIDLIVVSQKCDEIKKCYEEIDKIISSINSKINEDDEKFFVRYKKIYSVFEAEFFEITKPVRIKNRDFTFGSLVDNLNYDKNLENQTKNHKSKVISFYSYKGGVGRTVTLIQTAHLLAENGKKVAIIDLDIEAPSFNDIFEKDIKGNKGIINYLYDSLYKKQKILFNWKICF